MALKQRLMVLTWSLTVAFLVGLSWASTAFAAGGDGDAGGVGADDLLLPIALIVGGLIIVGVIVFAVSRRRTQTRGR